MFFDPWSLLLPYHVIGSDNRQQSLLSHRHQAENVGGVMVSWYWNLGTFCLRVLVMHTIALVLPHSGVIFSGVIVIK
ncbi:predicted protein [Lichtheimia corymbifera JMRC:FSU:9682]|uniref:Uncharacterized protein n=1 Tax=Lichtheimia corymbifera JMRC:FSU:9682 TaxID=1263082 RepID=A0A068RP57_9FUNG|nr:predicted protein [Lichtheimia corymbifera JMRC:FSU:9682]